jgi:hypothetical protein
VKTITIILSTFFGVYYAICAVLVDKQLYKQGAFPIKFYKYTPVTNSFLAWELTHESRRGKAGSSLMIHEVPGLRRDL